VRPHDRLLDDEPLGEGHTGQGAKLRVTALDELLKARGCQARSHGIVPGRSKLRGVTRQGAPFGFVMVAHIDDE
jgi:hypothetical protein